MYTQIQLENKAKVFFVPLEHTKSVTILVMYPVGSRCEPEKLAGASHYIEHLMFKGTKKRPSTLKLTREIDRLGAEYNAFTGKEYTGYYIKVDAEYLKIALDILSDMLFDSLFDAREMEREKGVIIEEIRMYQDNPLMNIDNIFEDLLYKGCPLGRNIAGTEKHVMNYKRTDVLKYRDTHYDPRNMIIAVAGNIPPSPPGLHRANSDIEQIVNKYFGLSKNGKVSPAKFEPFCLGPAKKSERIVVEQKKTDQTQLMLGFPCFKYNDSRNPTLAVLNTILGGSMSSRLFIKIRERRGLAYLVRSGMDNFHDTGYQYIRAGLEAKNINKTIEVVKKEIEEMIKVGVSKKELQDAKTHLRGALILSLEDSSVEASLYARQAIYTDKIKTPDQKLAEVDKVSNEDIMKVAEQVFQWGKVRVAVIGDVSVNNIVF